MTQPPEGHDRGAGSGGQPPPPPPPIPYAPVNGPAQPGGAYADPYAARSPSAQQGKGLSIAAFVLGLICCTGPLGVVVGIIALVKKQALKGLAIAGIVLGAISTVAIIWLAVSDLPERLLEELEESQSASRDDSGQVTESQTVGSQDLRLGDCFNDEAADEMLDGEQIESGELEIVPCSQPHQLEVFYVHEIAGDEFPGEDAVIQMADEECITAFEPFVGMAYEESTLEVYYYYPVEMSWDILDDRSIVCAIADSSPMAGSLEGAAR